jgi:hypothetical protein
MRYTAYFASALLALLSVTTPAAAQQAVRHSGTIVDIADDVRTFVLAEVGPWQVRNGETVITRRTITLAPETQYAMVGRVDDAPSGFPGDFVEAPIGPEWVYLHDQVTVECRHDGKKLVAVKITVVELPPARPAAE